MREAVSDVLAGRAREADGLSRMVLYSFGAHVLLVAVVALLPRGWLSPRVEQPQNIITISFAGSPGQDTGGGTQVAARPVQAVAPPEQRQPFALPPATKPPEMVENTPKPTAPRPRVEKPAEKSSTRKPATGEEIRSGASRVDTRGVAVPFGGLSTSGGEGLQAQTLGLENFCCPDYVQTMLQSIRRNWREDQGASGKVVVRYTIRRDGMLTNIEVTQPSGNFLLDQESRRAVITTARLPPLPAQYTEQNLTIHLTFEYRR